jgi:prepilin-type N-terminal cleavage/methylation domain-containing protein/prepilin-type processing-associated H-X9-DG protein
LREFNSIMPSRRRASAFTLVELLVVITIIAVLLAVLMPSLGKAKEMTKRMKCGTNLHQLMLAWLMYADENSGMAMPAKDYNKYNTATGHIQFWNGHWVTDNSKSGGGYLIPEEGYIWKYAPHGKLNACPSLRKDMILDDHGQLGYGYNFRYLSSQDDAKTGSVYITRWTKLVRITQPSRKVAFADCARNKKNTALGFPQEMTPFLDPPRQQYPSFQGRHSETGNVAWIDGHISVEKPVLSRAIYNINAKGESPPWGIMSASYAKKLNVGDIDEDGDPDTDELFSTYIPWPYPK